MQGWPFPVLKYPYFYSETRITSTQFIFIVKFWGKTFFLNSDTFFSLTQNPRGGFSWTSSATGSPSERPASCAGGPETRRGTEGPCAQSRTHTQPVCGGSGLTGLMGELVGKGATGSPGSQLAQSHACRKRINHLLFAASLHLISKSSDPREQEDVVTNASWVLFPGRRWE